MNRRADARWRTFPRWAEDAGAGRGTVPAGNLVGLAGAPGVPPNSFRGTAGLARCPAGRHPWGGGKGHRCGVLFQVPASVFRPGGAQGHGLRHFWEPVVEYQTTEDAVLVSGQLTVDIPVEAVVAGASAMRLPAMSPLWSMPRWASTTRPMKRPSPEAKTRKTMKPTVPGS